MNPVRRHPGTASASPYPATATAQPPARSGRARPARQAMGLLILTLALGVALAVALGATVWLIGLALHAAATA